MQRVEWGHRCSPVADDCAARAETALTVRDDRDFVVSPCWPAASVPLRLTTAGVGGLDLPDLACRGAIATAPDCELIGRITAIQPGRAGSAGQPVLDCPSDQVIGDAMAHHMRSCCPKKAGPSPRPHASVSGPLALGPLRAAA